MDGVATYKKKTPYNTVWIASKEKKGMWVENDKKNEILIFSYFFNYALVVIIYIALLAY